jgi:hypothetical protein
MTNPMPLDASDIGATLGESPQRRRAERAKANDHDVLGDDFHRADFTGEYPFPELSFPARAFRSGSWLSRPSLANDESSVLEQE